MDVMNDLRKRIDGSGRTNVQLAEATGVHRSAISRFVRRERDLSIASTEKILAALGLELTVRPRRWPAKKKKRQRRT